MGTTVLLREEEDRLLKEMESYIEVLRIQIKTDPKTAKKEAIEALIRTGVMNKNGKVKETIISWE